MKHIYFIAMLMISISITNHTCRGEDASKNEAIRKKTNRMIAELKLRQEYEVLKAIHDAMSALDGRLEKIRLLKAISLLNDAKTLDPDNKDLQFILHILHSKQKQLDRFKWAEFRLELKQPITVNYDKMSLKAVIDDLRKKSGNKNLVPVWVALLNHAGIERDIQINLSLRGIPFERVLDIVLRQASELTGELEPIGWMIIDDVIFISSKKDLLKISNDKIASDLKEKKTK